MKPDDLLDRLQVILSDCHRIAAMSKYTATIESCIAEITESRATTVLARKSIERMLVRLDSVKIGACL